MDCESSAERRGAPALHGRRTGKALAPYRRELVRTLLPRLAVDLSAPIDPAALFVSKPHEIWLEIGFGSGEHLISSAIRYRDVGLIGCEPFLNGMARALAGIASADLDNIRLHCGDAGEVIDFLSDATIDRVLIFYPDPWPKRRQHKRRFISDDMLGRLARIMRADAELCFVTDIDDYCGWTLARILRSPDFVWTATRSADWRTPFSDWVETRYEAKTKKQGRLPCYLTAKRLPS